MSGVATFTALLNGTPTYLSSFAAVMNGSIQGRWRKCCLRMFLKSVDRHTSIVACSQSSHARVNCFTINQECVEFKIANLRIALGARWICSSIFRFPSLSDFETSYYCLKPRAISRVFFAPGVAIRDAKDTASVIHPHSPMPFRSNESIVTQLE